MIPINTIKQIVGDFARPTRYWVQINIPPIMAEDPLSRSVTDIQMNCNSAQMPGISMGTGELRTKGPIRKMPNDIIYSDMNLSFYNRSKYQERKFFEHWINGIIDKDSKNFNYYHDYTTYIIIAQYDMGGQMVHSVRLNEAYPTAVGEIALSYESTDQIETFPVTFSFRDWEEIEASNPILDTARQFISGGFSKFFS